MEGTKHVHMTWMYSTLRWVWWISYLIFKHQSNNSNESKWKYSTNLQLIEELVYKWHGYFGKLNFMKTQGKQCCSSAQSLSPFDSSTSWIHTKKNWTENQKNYLFTSMTRP